MTMGRRCNSGVLIRVGQTNLAWGRTVGIGFHIPSET